MGTFAAYMTNIYIHAYNKYMWFVHNITFIITLVKFLCYLCICVCVCVTVTHTYNKYELHTLQYTTFYTCLCVCA